MAELKIRVSAAADPSLKTVFKPIEEAAARAQQAAKRSASEASKAGKATAEAGEKGAAAQSRAADKTAAAHARAAARVERELAKLAQAEVRVAARAAEAHARAEQRKTQTTMREFDRRLQAAKRAHEAEEREIMRTAAKAQQAAAKTSAAQARTGQAAQRSARGRDLDAARDGLRRGVQAAGFVGREVAQGLGVDFSIGGTLGRNTELAKRATLLSLQSRRDGSEQQFTAAEVEAQIRESATAGGFSNLSAAEGVAQFSAKTGDVAGALRLMRELGPLAQATGTSLTDIVAAAGEASNALGSMKGEERIKAITNVMRAWTAQGMEGSVEISDLASQAAKLSAAAGLVSGDRGQNLGTLGAILQVARAKGGATSAEEAGTSVSGMINTLKTGARRKRFAEAGVEIEDATTGLLRDPRKIIEDSIVAADTNTLQFKQMWANVSGGRAVEGFRADYLEARAKAKEGGASDQDAKRAGLTAIRSTFDRFSGATLEPEKVKAMMGEREGDADLKAQRFQNRLDELGAKAGEKLLPALEKLSPLILQLADAFGQAVAWASENPGKALTAAIVGSIVKARIGDTLADVIKGAAGGGAGGGPGGGVGPGGAALGVGVAGVAGFMVGREIVQQGFDEKDSADATMRGRSAEWENQRSAVAMKVKTGQTLTPADAEALLSTKRELEAALEGAEASQGAGRAVGGGLSAALNFVSAGSAGTSAERQGLDAAANRQAEVLKSQLEAVNATMLQVLAATRDKGVIVENMPSVLVEQVGRTTDFVGGFFGMGGGR